MAMHNPPHPGGIVKRQCLEPLGLTVTRAARGLGVTRQAFGSTPETWLGMQMAYDLWHARSRAREIAVERFVAA